MGKFLDPVRTGLEGSVCNEEGEGALLQEGEVGSPLPSAGAQETPFNGQDSVTIAFKLLWLFLLRSIGFRGPEYLLLFFAGSHSGVLWQQDLTINF